MSILLQCLFFFNLIIIFYVYAGYPMLLVLLGTFKNQIINKGSIPTFVSIIIAAYNEERVIAKNLDNKLNLKYPASQLEIIVVSDGSTDRTDQIVEDYKSNGVRLIRQEPRAGKTSALNLAVAQAKGEILVFSDANSIYEVGAIDRLVRNFHDAQVGYVTGKMIYFSESGSASGDGSSAYMKYENFIRSMENKIGSVVGVDGGIDAVRKGLYVDMRDDQLPDFVLPLQVIEQGYRVVYEPEAVLEEEALQGAEDEYRMRVRVALRAMWALADMRQLLSLKKFGFFAFQLWSHKVLRYGCFLFLLMAYGTNLLLWPTESFYKTMFIIQNLAYIAALIGLYREKNGSPTGILKFFTYFLLINCACAHAFIKFATGRKQILWNPRKG